MLGNYRAGHRRSQQIFMLVHGTRLQRGENVAGEEFLTQVFDYDFAGASLVRLLDNGLNIVSLTNVCDHRDDVIGVVLLQPRNDDGHIKTSGISEYKFFRHERSSN